MAVGDVVSDISTIGAAAHWTFQPAAGDEYEINGVGSNLIIGSAPDATPDVNIGLNDDSLISSAFNENTAYAWFNRPMHITNPHYLDIQNTGAGNANLSYWGVQTKD